MAKLYSIIIILGMLSVPTTFIMGYRFDASAPPVNYLFNVLAFIAFMGIHIIMLLPAFKKAVYGKPHSTSGERRIYMIVSIVTWLMLYYFHKPVPGLAFPVFFWVQFAGVCCVIYGILMFFEGTTFDFLSAFSGTPGTELSHSSDGSTPLMTDGSYAEVRHPMYRGAVIYTLASLLIHPHSGQLLFVILIALGFILFIPIEEKSLIKSRGDEYREYMKAVPYRIIPGIW